MKNSALTCLFLLFSISTMAMVDSGAGFEDDQMDYIDNSTLDVSGQFAAPAPRMSAADRARKQRQKLEAHTQMIVQKKMENYRFKRELQLQKEMQRAFQQQIKALDSLQ